jgi:hypothetical protein
MYCQASRLGMAHWQNRQGGCKRGFHDRKNAVDDSKMDDAIAPTVNGAMLAVIHENSKSHTRQNHLRLSW